MTMNAELFQAILTAAGTVVGLATAVFGLAAAVIERRKAATGERTDSGKQQAMTEHPIEVIVRDFDNDNGKLCAEKVLRLRPGEELAREFVGRALTHGPQGGLLPSPPVSTNRKGRRRTNKAGKRKR